ncbi:MULTISPECIES: PP2C family protein-serine/threonine phosphatase [unclassified Curtobacterium]|uniref:PP2C family protein-serine/threonine phosphatase n=1 Tax=unclassified Curtobacterium TaxID=257496 RepID=UPI000D824D53|nr:MULTISPECIES: GAF domain-containing SpoIIE family protein phosphatase [unclassified Curtobacterium]PYY31613.1 serine phosphatase [Curtobacterium sp. MCBD17_030]PZE36986.1 serine phosphatase [Curtobacterium sp. MCPF17_031]PZF15654.1 serine phosphatase [Curtobacterium sp. MCPF17_011]
MDNDGSRSARAALVAALDIVGLAPSERFDRIVRIAREVFDVPFSYVNLLDDTLLHTLTPNTAGEPTSGPLEWSFCQLTVQRPGPTVVPDTLADPRTVDLPGVTSRGIRFYAGVPLTMPGDLTIGSLCLMDVRPREFSPQDEAALIDLGRWTEQALTKGMQHDRLLEVVEALTPPPVHVPGYALAGLSVPYGDLSGDVHDWTVADDAVTFTLADIMGKEQPAALLAAGLRAALRQHEDLPPVDAVGAVEPRISEDLSRASAFATLFHSRLTPSTGRVDFVDAGHGLVVHLHADGTSDIRRSRDLPLGLHPQGVPFRLGSLVLEPGDALLVASDGALDLGDGTIDTLTDIGRTFRRAPSTAAFLETVRLRAAEHAEDDVTVTVLARDAD